MSMVFQLWHVFCFLRRTMEHNDALLKKYFSEIERYPLLSFEEEKDLSRKIKAGDRGAFETLVNSNLRLSVSIAKRYVSSDLPLIDLIQEGNIGLLRAAEDYSFSRGCRFSTYATWWIRQTITRAIDKKSRIVRLPGRKETLARRIRQTEDELALQKGRLPSFREIAGELGVDEKKVAEVYAASEPAFSLDAEYDSESGACFKDLVADNTFNPEDRFLEKCGKAQVRRMVRSLKKNEAYVVSERFGFNDERKKRTFSCLGKNLGVSAETVRQTEIRALKKLRAAKEDFFAVSP